MRKDFLYCAEITRHMAKSFLKNLKLTQVLLMEREVFIKCSARSSVACINQMAQVTCHTQRLTWT